jgi:tetratricopeptide (TPR) repeat protein
MPRRLALTFALLAGLVAAPAFPSRADTLPGEIRALDEGWVRLTYQSGDAARQARLLAQLSSTAQALVAQYPGQAEPLLWHGILLAEQANRASLFRKLGLATRSRDAIARAYRIDPRVGGGKAAIMLGVLYYKVPGSPIGFGDTDRARVFLREALAIDPDGLDANYFYGDFLLTRGDKAGARSYLRKALEAPRDPARPVWDAGRRRDIQAALRKAA